MHPFKYLMIGTFIAAAITLLVGVTGMHKSKDNPGRATKLMAMRVALCALLLGEMLIYAFLIR